MARKTAGWPWRPFVYLSFIMALVPGFIMGGLMWAAVALGWDTGWYAAARQAHGHAQLLGWGGAMIFGVGLHFLPRLRGAKLSRPEIIPGAFYFFAAGITLRVAAQPLTALVSSSGARPGRLLLAVGTAAETLGMLAILYVLLATLRQGPPLAKKPGFAQIIPALAVAGLSLLAALGAWAAGGLTLALTPVGRGGESLLIAQQLQQLGVAAALFGFIPALSLAMSARIFPLFYRIQAPYVPVLNGAAALLAAGLLTAVTETFWSAVPAGLSDLLFALGLLTGTAAVKVFARRQVFPGDQGQYRIHKEPAAVGAIAAYFWAVAGSLALALSGLHQLGVAVAAPWPPRDWSVHALGAGFMTLLIVAVAPVMIPGFGGGRPVDRQWLWLAVILANLAVLLRTLFISHNTAVLAISGLAGAGATVALAMNLRIGLQARRGA